MSSYDDYDVQDIQGPSDNKSGVLLPTKKEAENIIERSRDKEFWNCDVVDNLIKLKGAIDVLYNCIPGNNYETRYKYNQSSTRLEIFCHPCAIDLSSYDPFISHEQGRNHKKVRQQKEPLQEKKLSEVPNLRKEFIPWDFIEEEDGTIEKKLNGTSRTVVGAQMVYKEMINGVYYFTCTLCQEDGPYHRILKDEMYEHITSGRHSEKYLRIKFEINDNFVEEAKKIEKREGKIHHMLADFTEEDSDYENYSSTSSVRSASPDRKRSRNGYGNKPILAHKGTSVNSDDYPLLDVCRPILVELDYLNNKGTKDQAAEMVSNDTELQGHLINSLWSINTRLEKYYELTNKKYQIPGTPAPFKLRQCSQKIKQYITKLELVDPNN